MFIAELYQLVIKVCVVFIAELYQLVIKVCVVFITELYQLVIKANQTENSERRMLKLKKLLHELPEMNFETFRFLARHLAVIASKEVVNKVRYVMYMISQWAPFDICFCCVWRNC